MKKVVLLLFLSYTFTSGQTDFRDFISIPDKFSARGILPSNPSPLPSSSRASRPAGRRNLFFPPPDRLSPTLRPILSHQDVTATSPKATTPLSRFHPPVQSQSFSVSHSEKANEYDDIYYEYYEEYIYGEPNTTENVIDTTTTTAPTHQPLSVKAAAKSIISEPVFSKPSESKLKKHPTAFSKFHSGNFRFNSSPKETVNRNSFPIRTTPKTPFRFKFSTQESVKSTRPSPIRKSKNTSNRKGLLADLLSKLSNQDDDPSNNDVDSQRQERINKVTTEQPDTTTRLESRFKHRTNSSSRSFSVSSFSSSRSAVEKESTTVNDFNSDVLFSTTTAPEDTTHYSYTKDNEISPKSTVSRIEGKRVLDDSSANKNLANTVLQFQGPPISKPFSSLFENIQIAVDPSLLPPGYAVESNITNIVINESNEQTTSSSPVYETTVSEKYTGNYPNSNKITSLSSFISETTSEIPFNSAEKSTTSDANLNLKSNSPTNKKGIDLSKLITKVNVSSFLPPGFKVGSKGNEEKSSISGIKVSTVNPSKFLPPRFRQDKEPIMNKNSQFAIKNVDISSFLPTGYKVKNEDNDVAAKPKPSLPIIKSVDISNFLPPGFSNKKGSSTESTPTTRKIGKLGLVFPKRPNRPEYITSSTTRKPTVSGPPPIKPKIQNIFERVKALATTEYKPPIVTEDPKSNLKTSSTTSSTTTTTTTTPKPTTTTPPRPTTPGVCGSACRLAASLRLISGTEWKPELANRDTFEFQILANEIENELDAFYRSSSLSLWYDYVEVDAFNPGSVIVSYILSLSYIEADLDTLDLKQRMNDDLGRLTNHLGNFTVDPKGTDFIVIPERQVLIQEDSQNFLIPEWLIAVIVIGLASFLFIVIFGVVALVSRARVRKRANIPLTEEFLNNLNALQVNGIDNYAMNGLYDMDPVWSEKFQGKAMKAPSSRGKGYNPEYNVNIYDSWRTDYSAPYTSSNHSKRRPGLDMDGSKQFYKDDPYDDF